ncbi:MAG: hypothetical protein JO050_06920 [Acidimicrobiia bacterium]|nr:hypothetical protein [Acidimicrobiia bacterium]
MLNNQAASSLDAPQRLPAGTRVRVRSALGSWAGGFEVVAVDGAGYVLRRVSDGALLPRPIVASEVRRG